jgi:hypothetical protein
VFDLFKTVPAETALQRSISHMVAWGDANSAPWNHYFLYVSLSRACFDIKDGKISPWLVLHSGNGKAMLQKFNDEQLNAVGAMIDPPFWVHRFKKLPADVEFVKEVIRESDL